MKFRPCIDLHDGKVKQIVGSTLNDDHPEHLRTNFTATHPSSWFADLYRADNLTGGHIIKLGPGNEAAALEVLPPGLAGCRLAGPSPQKRRHIGSIMGTLTCCVTSYVFREGMVDEDRLRKLVRAVGKERLVLDLSCRRGTLYSYRQMATFHTSGDQRNGAGPFFSGMRRVSRSRRRCGRPVSGSGAELIVKLAAWSPIPVTYAGGVRNLADLELIRTLGQGRLDATVGSALDIFGGTEMTYADAVRFHKAEQGEIVSDASE